MKKITIILILSFFYSSIFGQQTPLTKAEFAKLESGLDNELNSYDKDEDDKIVQDKLLRENILNAFNNVVFGNSNLVENSSSFGYSQNEEKTNVSASAMFKIFPKSISGLFISTGAGIQGSGSIFEFYSDESWENSVTGNFSVVYKFGKSGQFYTLKTDEKKSRMDRRKIYKNKFLSERKYFENSKDVKRLGIIKGKLIKDVYKDFNLETDLPNYPELNSFEDIKGLIAKKKFLEAYDLIEKKEKELKSIVDASKDNEKLVEYIQDTILYDYDKENDITTGYHFWWLRAGINLGNNTYSFDKDNIDPLLANNTSLTESINKLKTTSSLDVNRIFNSKNYLYYLQGGTSITTGSILNNSLIEGTPSLFLNGIDTLIRDENGIVFGNFDQIDQTLSTGSLYFYGALFFGAKKKLGFNVSLKQNYLITRPENTFYENNYTILFGPLFRTIKDDNTSISFGIDIGWENAIYDVKASDYFTGRIRLGIPFGIYKKAKKSEKK